MERSSSRAPNLVLANPPQLSLFGPDSEEDSSDESVQEDTLGTITAPLSADVSTVITDTSMHLVSVAVYSNNLS